MAKKRGKSSSKKSSRTVKGLSPQIVKYCLYRNKKRCLVFGCMCSFAVNSPLSICGQARPVSIKVEKARNK